MADGLGNAIGGLLGVAIMADVAGKIMKGNQKLIKKPMKMKRRKTNNFGI
jgi:hypothetical protein